MTGKLLLALLPFGQWSAAQTALAPLAANAAQVGEPGEVAPEASQQRMTRRAVAFLQDLIRRAFAQLHTGDPVCDESLFTSFPRGPSADSTGFGLPDTLKDLGGQLGTTYEVANYPGFQLVTGPDLVQKFFEHVEQYGVEKLIGEKVTGMQVEGRVKVLQTASGREIRAKTVIITTGAQKRKLNIPGEKQLAGKGVVYCSTCDGPLFKDLPIAIIGGGNSGLEAAIEMDGVAKKVYLVSRGEWTGDEILQDKVAAAKRVEVLKHHQPVEIHGKERVEGLTVKDLQTGATHRLEVQGVFIEIGLFPQTDFLLDLVETNERGEIKVDRHGQTGVRGIFAAGDATDSHDKQIVIAAGEGAKAALATFEYLVKQV